MVSTQAEQPQEAEEKEEGEEEGDGRWEENFKEHHDSKPHGQWTLSALTTETSPLKACIRFVLPEGCSLTWGA